MRAFKNSLGLFEFAFEVIGPRKRKTLKGLIDTGSTDCACTYKVITSLWLRPTDKRQAFKVDQPAGKINLIYEVKLALDTTNKCRTVPVVRVTNLPPGFDFICGMSVLKCCRITMLPDSMDICWI